ncbi:MAG: C-GCAxxG-C-C family (seleno)protein [Candidatus Gastranaerophilaceae bacterium]|jgi:C_GCAxxG_C_C family probable redox protein
MSKLENKAKELFLQGYSCSEAVLRAAYLEGLFESKSIDELNKVISMFAGGMLSGCICGAVVGAQASLGMIYGRKELNNSDEHKKIAQKYIENFKKIRNVTCCKALSSKYDFHSPERRENCVGIISDAVKILQNMVEEKQIV